MWISIVIQKRQQFGDIHNANVGDQPLETTCLVTLLLDIIVILENVDNTMSTTYLLYYYLFSDLSPTTSCNFWHYPYF